MQPCQHTENTKRLLQTILAAVDSDNDYFISGSLSFLPLLDYYRWPGHDIDFSIGQYTFGGVRRSSAPVTVMMVCGGEEFSPFNRPFPRYRHFRYLFRVAKKFKDYYDAECALLIASRLVEVLGSGGFDRDGFVAEISGALCQDSCHINRRGFGGDNATVQRTI
jgi:hypothetical protein